MEALQPYADYLYDAIVEDLERDKSLIFSDLMRAARDAVNPELISVPFWRFVSSITPPLNPWDEDRDDSYIGVSETSYSGWLKRDTTDWVLPPIAMDRLFRETDLLTRLSLFLGEKNFEVRIAPTPIGWADDEGNHVQNELLICFSPRGVGPEQLARIEAVKDKYNSYYTPRPLEEGEVVVRSGDACRPPKTPDVRPGAATTVPPLLPMKRSHTLVAESDDEDEGKGDDGSDSVPISQPCFCASCTYPDDE